MKGDIEAFIKDVYNFIDYIPTIITECSDFNFNSLKSKEISVDCITDCVAALSHVIKAIEYFTIGDYINGIMELYKLADDYS